MIKTNEALAQFAKTVFEATKPYGLKPSVENLTVWYERLKDLPLGSVVAALDCHVAECPKVLPSPDAIRERIVGNEHDPVESAARRSR